MELVSANTKEFLYVTLSQYNEKTKPERARVQMRRDEPFWQGGNSYIACESFRISSSPNPDGLYYKKIPESWFMGAQGGTETFVGQGGQWAPITNPANPAHTSMLWPVDFRFLDEAGDDMKILLGLRLLQNNVPPGQQPALIAATRPDLVNRELAGYFGNTLREGSQVRLSTADNNGNVVTVCRVIHAPQPHFRAEGGGPSGMFFPLVDQARVVHNEMQMAGGGMGAITMESISMGPDDVPAFTEMVGRGTWLQSVSQTPVAHGPRDATNGGYFPSAYYRVLGPNGIDVSADFTNAQPLYTGGELNYYCYLEGPLRVGIPITLISFAAHANGIRDVYGTVSAVPGFMEKPHEISSSWSVAPTQLLLTTIAGNTQHRADVLQQQTRDGQFIFTCTPLNWTGTILTEVGVNANQPNTVAVQNLQEIDKITNPVAQQKQWTRRGPEVTYTPGEFMQFFNRPEHAPMTANSEQPPWTLTTDVNGGFVVKWKIQPPSYYSEFMISW